MKKKLTRKPLKKIPWWIPQVGKKEYKWILQALDTNYPNQGPLTERFEKEIEKLLSVRHAVATNSGTIAIFLALKACGVEEGDEVIVPDVTFIATANAARLAGAKVVLVDVNPRTLMLEPAAFRRAITKRTKAVVPVHISGRAAPMASILAIARNRHIRVVEDAAEALMSKHNGKLLGTFGDAGCFSLSPNKTITSGQGGIVVTNSDDVYKRLRQLKNHGVVERLTGGDDVHPAMGYNFRFTDLQAGLALGQLSYLKKRITRMKRTHELYKKHLTGINGFRLFTCDTKKGEVPQWTDALVDERDAMDAYLHEQNIDCRRFWFPLHTQAPYKLSDTLFPHSTTVAPKAIWLPSAFTMTDRDVLTVCRQIKEFFSGA